MPELPEVEVVRAGLAPAVSGSEIRAVRVFDARSLKRYQGSPEQFASELTGATLLGAVRRGKFLWFPLADSAGNSLDRVLLAHLGMSGQMLLRTAEVAADRHNRIELELAHPEFGDLLLRFADQRIFGSLAIDNTLLLESAAGFAGAQTAHPWTFLLPSQVSHIARDPLDPEFDLGRVIALLQRRATAIKRVLLDQNTVSGIGNIYADEALWAAGIHYETPAQLLTVVEVERLFAEVVAVLNKALAEGGTSFDSQYLNVNGEAGYFAHSLNAYGQQGKPCPRCGTAIVREKFMNRSSHLCPECQRLVG